MSPETNKYSVDDYYRRAESDRLFGENTCEGAGNLIWAFISYFYSALHYVNACLCKDGLIEGIMSLKYGKHGKMLEVVNANYGEDVYIAYDRLYQYGRGARYDPTWIPRRDDRRKIRADLRAVKSFSERHVAPSS